MARGSSKLGGRGRDRDNANEAGSEQSAWQPDAVDAPAAPSPARNILPGQPFEPVASPFPTQREPEAATSGWGMLPTQGGFEPSGAAADPNTISWPSEITAPMQAVPVSVGAGHAMGDPLDALQQYAGLPLGGYPGAAPAPDPTQLYQPQAPAAGTPNSPTASATPNETAPIQNGYGSPADSGFADGGIFTGSESFDGIPAAPGAFAPTGYSFPGGFDQQLPPVAAHLPQSSLEPLDVLPLTSGPALGGSVLPGGDEVPAERSGRGRRRRGKADDGGNDSGYSDVRPEADSPLRTPASNSGARRAVALLGAVAVLGGAGYVGYSQMTGTDEALSSPSAPVRPATATAKYALPNQLANLAQITPEQSKALTASYTTLSTKNSPGLPLPIEVSAYRPTAMAAPTVNVVIYKPAGQNVYNALLGSLSRPAPGNASVAAVPVAPGAASGTMMCGSQRGKANSAWCAWTSSKGIGFLTTKGTSNTSYAAVYTRELRAFAER